MMDRRTFFKWAGLATGSALVGLSSTWWVLNREQEVPTRDPFAPEPWQVAQPAGPVLALINEDSGHPFGRFLAEILWAEGLNAFTAARLADASPALLEPFACVLVSAGECSPETSGMLANYAAQGGKLIVFQPEGNLARELGLDDPAETISEGTLWTESLHPLAAGITQQPISLHVRAGLYAPEGAEILARLDGHTQPGLFLRRLGSGMVAAWAYDLAWNIVLTRQGNPANAAGGDHKLLQRPVDLFKGWIDFERMKYPQADEQQRLLANIIHWMCKERLPLPRIWYFPGQARGMLIATSDSHRNTFRALERITGEVEQRQGSMTLNYTPPLPSEWGLAKIQAENLGAELGVSPQPYFPTPQEFNLLRARGHSISMHPYITDTYVDSIQRYWKAFNRMHYGPIPSTIRIHDLDWRGWSDAPRILAGFGMRMNSDYYHYGPLFHIGLDEWAFGHFSGSGLPMRFANEDGRILDIYQQVTQFGDEHFFEVPWTSPENMGPKRGAETTAALFQSSLEGNFAAIAINFHSDPYDMEDRYRLPATEFLAGTLDAAHEKGLPIWNTERWLNFTSARQSARFEALNWADQTLAFDLTVPEQPQDGLSVLIPLDNNQAALSWVRVDGEESEFVNWRVGGVKYGLVSLAPGSHHVAAGYA